MVSKDGYVKILDFGLAKLTEPAGAGRVGPSDRDRRADRAGHRHGHGRLHVARAGERPAGGLPLRSVLARRDPLRDGDRQARLPAKDRRRDARRDHPRGAGAAVAGRAEGSGSRALDRRALLAKDPEERYASTKDLARDLKSLRDHLTETSVSGALAPAEPAKTKRRGRLALAAATLARRSRARLSAAQPRRRRPDAPLQLQRLTFAPRLDPLAPASRRTARRSSTARRGRAGPSRSSRRAPTAPSRVPSACRRPTSSPSRRTGELALSLNRRHFVSVSRPPGRSRACRSRGGAPREVLEDVEDADWSPDGKALAVVPTRRQRLPPRVPDRKGPLRGLRLDQQRARLAGRTIDRLRRPSPEGRQQRQRQGRRRLGKLRLSPGPMPRGASPGPSGATRSGPPEATTASWRRPCPARPGRPGTPRG